MKAQTTQYFISSALSPERAPGILVDVSVQGVPFLLNGLEIRKAERNWLPGEWAQGYQWLAEQQELLLMDASNRIIDEIRQARGALNGQELVPTDPTITAVYPGVSLRQLLYDDTSGLEGINEKLQILVDQAVAESNEEQLEALQQIVFLLGGAL